MMTTVLAGVCGFALGAGTLLLLMLLVGAMQRVALALERLVEIGRGAAGTQAMATQAASARGDQANAISTIIANSLLEILRIVGLTNRPPASPRVQ